MKGNQPHIAFRWEWNCTPFWPDDDVAREVFGLGPIDPSDLGLPEEILGKIDELASWHDTALNWSYPPDPGPWRQSECDRFTAASRSLFAECMKYLEGRFELAYAHVDESEDPDLDEYLQNPKGFKRKGA